MVISFETSMLYIYCDGDLLASAPCNNVTKLAGGFAKVLFVAGRPVDGAESGGGDIVDGLKGSVAEIRLWSIPRSPDEILVTRSRSALSGTEERLLGCWRVDEGSSHIIHDTRYVTYEWSRLVSEERYLVMLCHTYPLVLCVLAPFLQAGETQCFQVYRAIIW